MQTALEDAKRVFDIFDGDGSGFISLAELSAVLKSICGFDEKECKVVFEQIDKSVDGRLDFAEFCGWMRSPLSALSLRSAHASSKASLTLSSKSRSNWESLLEPLFDIFDKDRTGSISVDEFKQCHAIIRGAVAPADTADMKKCVVHRSSSALFDTVDVSGEGQVTLDEFCEWQRRLLPDSGLEFNDLRDMIQWITKELTFILDTSVVNEKGVIVKADGQDDDDWEYVLSSLADSQQQLWRSEEGAKFFSQLHLPATCDEAVFACTSACFDPCRSLHVASRERHLDIQSLLKTHMADCPVSARDAQSLQYAKLCVPLLPMKSGECGLRWVALVRRRVVNKDGTMEEITSAYQFTGDLRRPWEPQQDLNVFVVPVRKMSPEITFLWLLKTEANMKNSEISWSEIQRSLQTAEDFGLIDAEQRHILHGRARDFVEKAGLAEYVEDCPHEQFTPVSHAWRMLMGGSTSGAAGRS